jgi:hypothetical protein
VREARYVASNAEAVQKELPVMERRLELAGVSSAVLEGGDGPPVLLLHGPGELAASWARVILDLARTHRVVATDLPGHGATGLAEARSTTVCLLAWRADWADLRRVGSITGPQHPLTRPRCPNKWRTCQRQRRKPDTPGADASPPGVRRYGSPDFQDATRSPRLPPDPGGACPHA